MLKICEKLFSNIYFLAVLIALPFMLGMIFPEQFWSTNNPYFLPLVTQIPLALALFFVIIFKIKYLHRINSDWKNNTIISLIIASLATILFYYIPISIDFYGDAYFIQQDVNHSISKWDDNVTKEIFAPDWLNSKVGLQTFYQLDYLLAFLLDINGQKALRILELILGFGFIFTWTRLALSVFQNNIAKKLFIIIGLTSPLLAVYMWHYETYSLSYLGILLWFEYLYVFIKRNSKFILIGLPFVYLLVLQTHIINWMLLPSLIISLIWKFRGIDLVKHKIIPHLNWKGFFLYGMGSMFILGSIAYIIVFDAHNGPRKFDRANFEEATFLPIFTNEPAPYDRYNLFSFNHIWDYLSLTWMWSAGLLLMLILALTKFRKLIKWNSPLVLASGSAFTILFVLFFFLNPLLGMVIDWDLFSTPGIAGFIFMLFAYGSIQEEIKWNQLFKPVLILSLLGTSFWLVNTDKNAVLNKIAQLGERNFKTYWIGTSTEIFEAYRLKGGDQVLDEFDECINRLEPFAIMGNDVEYANILLERSKYYTKENDLLAAKSTIDKALNFSPKFSQGLFEAIKINFSLQYYDEALNRCKELIALNHPQQKKIYKTAIHISLVAKDYQSAANYANVYNQKWKDSKLVQEIEYKLANGINIHNLVNLFN